MSDYKPVKGDRVRVSFEAEVAKVYSDGDFGVEFVEHYWTDFPHEADISIEKIEPPVEVFKPGDVVRSRDGRRLVVALARKGYTYLSGSLSDGHYFEYERGYTADEFTSRRYEKVNLG